MEKHQEKIERSERDLQIRRQDLSQLRREYLDERKLLIEAEHKAMEGFDKAMLTLSAGALGFSISYVQFISSALVGTGWLLTAWILFALAATLTAGSMYESHRAFREEQDYLHERYQLNCKDYLGNYGKPEEQHVHSDVDGKNELASSTKIMSSFSLAFFIVGAFCLLVFSWTNIGN